MALLHYYMGSMYAGKSTSAVQALLAATTYEQRIISSPSWQSRGYLSRNHSKDDIPKDIHIVANLQELSAYDLYMPIKTLLVIDEVQFCPDTDLDPILNLAQQLDHLDLIVSGLQVGQHAQPFHNGRKLLDLFEDRVTRLYAPCAICDSDKGLVAIRKWLINDHIRDEYSLLCQDCFDKFFHYGRIGLPIPDPTHVEEDL
ncbi:hypothetical protein PVA44_07100 (plasmid) [Entomospira nematocerorum]|uniref:thymidine kinase n=1 Tax=Entomospira nematocerorum TaxID=2719987 RepID=A0A968KUV1_9SPIO|nr:hypothetical protein [Entomospira nematocera]NIZ47674.1 hypothetical protein [Entomospira nematocera]WDI34566.1 hypothetical protein PVA44_07100 [Entomospira nematocera]